MATPWVPLVATMTVNPARESRHRPRRRESSFDPRGLPFDALADLANGLDVAMATP